MVVWLASCGKKACREDEGQRPLDAPLELVRLEDSISAFKSKEETRAFLLRHPLFAEKFLQWSRLPHDSILVNDVFKLSVDPYVDTMYMDVKKEFGQIEWLREDLTQLFSRIRYHYPDFFVPKIYTMVSGFGVDLEVKDSVVVIGLEYFLSDSSHYKPRGNDGIQLPNYILKRLKKPYLVSEIGMVVADRYCKINMLDNTMMGEMMKWGRLYYFLEKTMPCLPDTILSGYSQKELQGVEENLKTIWAHYLDKNLFFNTDFFLIKKYCDERPRVVEIGEDCPGRIGRWLGWQIVRKWAKDKNLSLQQVMQETDSRKIFQESGFKP